MHRIYSLLVLACILCSCEKVIDVDISDMEKKYVIEAVLSTEPGGCVVLVSQTRNIDENNDFDGISGAEVSIADNTGNNVVLTETATGMYQAPSLTALPGKSYALRVILNGQVFTATSSVPQPVNMDSIFLTEESLFSSTRRLVNVEYYDPPGKGNYYRFIQYINGIKEKKIFVRDDAFTDGNSSLIKLRYPDDDDNDIKSGDHIQVIMQCIDPAVYQYWYSLDQSATGDNNSASPANPVSNIVGGALGYFSAHTSQVKTMVAP